MVCSLSPCERGWWKRGWQIGLLVGWLFVGISAPLAAQDSEEREWKDSSGKFRVVGRLVEVRDGVVFLLNKDGKTLKVPVERLSSEDQEYLNQGANPFEMVEAGDSGTRPPAGGAGRAGTASGSGSVDLGASGWTGAPNIDWDDVEQLVTSVGVEWNVPVSEQGGLGFEAKRAALNKKAHFHERLHPLAVDPVSQRALVGFTVSFSVPKPLSRLVVVDLATGKAIQSEQVECHMRPLAPLGDGGAVLMVGAGDDRGGFETPDQLQVWKLAGKKVTRSASWVPYPDEKEHFGKRQNAAVVQAQWLGAGRALTCSETGHVVVWDIANRVPIWHARLGNNFAVEPSVDRGLLAILDEKTVMIVRADDGEVLGSASVAAQAHIGWPRLAWSPDAKRLLFTSIHDVRVLNLETGEWAMEFSMPGGGPVAPNALSFPHDDFALLDNRLLLHLPTRIQVCNYLDAGTISTVGGTSFIAIVNNEGGTLVPASFPHPAAEKLLAKAQSDPTLFLVHPGVAVAIDVSGVAPQYQGVARQGLEKAAQQSGYRVAPASPITLVASITGPTPEAVSYIARGSYVVNKYTSSIALRWNGQDLWQTQGTNVPGVLMTKGGETIEQALAEAGRQPNTAIFEQARFPEFLQKPAQNAQPGQQSSALMTSRFTLQGLVDAQ